MKKTLFLMMVLVMFPFYVFAADMTVEIPAWVDGVANFLFSIPFLGPVLKYLGILSVVLTLLVSILDAVQLGLSKLGKVVESEKVKKIADLILKYLPYIQYLSAYKVTPKK